MAGSRFVGLIKKEKEQKRDFCVFQHFTVLDVPGEGCVLPVLLQTECAANEWTSARCCADRDRERPTCRNFLICVCVCVCVCVCLGRSTLCCAVQLITETATGSKIPFEES